MARYFTNEDKVLQAVLSDSNLMKWGSYTITGVETINEALNSNNPIICAVAKIIYDKENKASEKEIYNEVFKYLFDSI